jgi:murein DD-endopeptidase MepM/ murein hydrolase activator NlpD
MFPLSKREITGFSFGVPTFYSNFHLGVDYGTEGMELHAPFDGKVLTSYGHDGGNTIYFYPTGHKEMIRFLHLDHFIKTGWVNMGDVIAITGNTGVSTRPHVHIDISKNGSLDLNNLSNFKDPEKFDWVGKDKMIVYKKQGEATIYFPADDKLLGYATDFATFQAEFPNAVTIELPPAEFAKFTISSLVVKK